MNVKSLLMAGIFAAGMQLLSIGSASAVEYFTFDGEVNAVADTPGGDLSITELSNPGGRLVQCV